jgi:hypothetical protein
VNIVWGNGFGGAYCQDTDNEGLKIQPYTKEDQDLSGCTITYLDGKKSYWLFGNITKDLSIKITGYENTLSKDAESISNIFATFKFDNPIPNK